MTNVERHIKLIQDITTGEVRMHELMKKHTTLRIGGPADIFILPNRMEEIADIIEYARDKEIPYYVIGNGSNLLVADSGIRGMVIKIGKSLSNKKLNSKFVKAQAGISLPKLSRIAAEYGLSGLEYGIGIPGTLGGAIVMNAGASGQDTSEIVTSVRVMNVMGEIIEIEKENLRFGYRESRLKRSGEIVLEATLQLDPRAKTTIREKMRKIIERRKRTMPLDYPSAGSVFKNPEGDYAGRLIEQAGCKGMRKGDAQVSELHANWILNLGHASASDVLYLISEVQNAVQAEFGFHFDLEICIL